jgi:hypothetical protein
LSFSIEILSFSIEILSFSIEILAFSIVLDTFSIEKRTFFTVFEGQFGCFDRTGIHSFFHRSDDRVNSDTPRSIRFWILRAVPPSPSRLSRIIRDLTVVLILWPFGNVA